MADKKEDIQRVYLFKGRDDYKKNREIEDLISSLIDEPLRDFDLEEHYGDNVSSDKLLTGVSIPAFSSLKKVVYVKFAHKINKEEQRLLAQNLEQIPSGGCLILSTPAPELKDGKPVSSFEVSDTLSKAIGKYGKIKNFDPITKKREIEEKVVPFVINIFSEEGKVIDKGVASLFVSRVGSNFTLLATEANKVMSYAGEEKRITASMVNDVTTLTPDEKIFQFLELVCNKNSAKAVSAIEDLYTDGNDPNVTSMRIISMLSSHIRLMWQARILFENKIPEALALNQYAKTPVRKEHIPDNIIKYFGKNSLITKESWQQAKFMTLARSNDFKSLAKWFVALEEADSYLKGFDFTNEEPINIIKTLVYKMLLNRGNK